MKIGTFSGERPLAALALCAGAGALAGCLAGEVPVFLCLGGMLSGALTALLCRRNKRLRLLGGCVLLLFMYLLRAGLYYHQPLPPEGEVTAAGTVLDEAVVRPEDGHVAVQLRGVTVTDAQGRAYRVSGAYWTWYGEEDGPVPEPGSTVTFAARLYHPGGQRNPYGFDFRQYLLQRGITVGLFNQGSFSPVPDAGFRPSAFFSRVRARLLSALDRIFGENSALPRALLFGARQDLTEETQEAFSRAGVAHVLAVSGLHVSLLAGALGLLLGCFCSPRGRFRGIAVFLLMYCALLGFRASVVRASVLTAAYLWGRTRKRQTDALSALCLSFLAIVMLQPADLISIGFRLSFSAVLGMMLLDGKIYAFLRPFLGRRVSRALSATVSATLGTVIPIARVFHYFSLAGLILSPLLCAALAVLLPCFLILLILGLIYLPLAALPAAFFGAASALLIRGVTFVSSLPLAAVNVPVFPWPLVSALLLGIWLLSPYASGRRGRKLAVWAAVFALGCAGHLLWIDRGLSYTQLDVGAADCAVLLDGRTTVVADTGEDGRDLCDWLLSSGRQVDLLVLTHLHTDHAGGVKELLRRNIPIRRAVIPLGSLDQRISEDGAAAVRALEAAGVPVEEWAAGDGWTSGRIRLTALWPETGRVRPGQDANDYSLALLAQMDEVTLLLCGDLTGTYEHYAAVPADVLKVAHHGSGASTGEAFLSAVRPSLALISAGANGAGAREDGQVQARLREMGIPFFGTARGGALRLDISGAGFTLTPFITQED